MLWTIYAPLIGYADQRWDELSEVLRNEFRNDADALIRELNLQPETLYCPGGAILTRLDGKVLAENRYMTRWATPWEADERPVK